MSKARSAAGQELRNQHIKQLIEVLGDREALSAAIAIWTKWSDTLTDAVLRAGMDDGKISRRLETTKEAMDRAVSSTRHTAKRRCFLYRVVVQTPPPEKPVVRRRDHPWRLT